MDYVKYLMTYAKKQRMVLEESFGIIKKKGPIIAIADLLVYPVIYAIFMGAYSYLGALYVKFPLFAQADPTKIMTGPPELAEAMLAEGKKVIGHMIGTAIIVIILIIAVYGVSRYVIWNMIAGKKIVLKGLAKACGVISVWILGWAMFFIMLALLIKRPLMPVLAILWAIGFLHFTHIAWTAYTQKPGFKALATAGKIGTKGLVHMLVPYGIALLVALVLIVFLMGASFIPFLPIAQLIFVIVFFAYMAWLRAYLYVVVCQITHKG